MVSIRITVKDLLFDTEKARMPDTMPAVEIYKSVKIFRRGEKSTEGKKLLK